jgi:hypothetical protein
MITALFAAPLTRAQRLMLVLLIAAQVALFVAPLIAPGQIIDWSSSLCLPGAQALPLVVRNFSAMQVGSWRDVLKAAAMVHAVCQAALDPPGRVAAEGRSPPRSR